MNRKEKLIIELLDEVDRLEKTIECYKHESVLFKDKADKQIAKLQLANEKLKKRILELESRHA